MRLDVVDDPTPEDREALVAPLRRYNQAHGPLLEVKPLALLLRDEAGNTVGGLWGRTAYDWLYVELLAVPEGMRGSGTGTALMRTAEAIALERGCIGTWLDTFAFQARPFYEKLGYSVFGELIDHPRGSARYFLMKRFS
jgi:GNAT superfamily N-acetyltransferase